MADPVSLAMVGAAAGAAMSPKDPLTGAMMGGAAGFGGGAMLGGAGGAAGATAAGSAAVPAGTYTGLGMAGSQAGGAAGAAAAGTAPGFGQQTLNFMNQNPTLTNQGFNLANNMMQEQPTQYAPPGQVSRGGPIQANDYMSLLAPQQNPVIMPQRLSLI